MPTINLRITLEEKLALIDLAKKELRDPKQQACLIIRKELERLGYLKTEANTQQAEKKDDTWLIS